MSQATIQPKIDKPEYLKLLRRRAKMTQSQAADFLGVSLRTIRNLEQGCVDVSDLHINKYEVKLGMINPQNRCPHCQFQF